jgi:hypothetical protein
VLFTAREGSYKFAGEGNEGHTGRKLATLLDQRRIAVRVSGAPAPAGDDVGLSMLWKLNRRRTLLCGSWNDGAKIRSTFIVVARSLIKLARWSYNVGTRRMWRPRLGLMLLLFNTERADGKRSVVTCKSHCNGSQCCFCVWAIRPVFNMTRICDL